MSTVERSHDVVVVDTPGTDSYLTRLAHSMADTLIKPLNDSFVDLDVIGTVDPTTFAVTGESHYATRREVTRLIEALKLPLDARGQRRAAARAEWFAALEKPLETHDVIDE